MTTGAIGGGSQAGTVQRAVGPVGAADARLARALAELTPETPLGPVRAAARDALAAGERGLRLIGSPSDNAGRHAALALRRHQALVDAVGSTLANPASPLRERLPALGRQAAEAFDELGSEAAGDAGELPVARFAAFSRRRAAG